MKIHIDDLKRSVYHLLDPSSLTNTMTTSAQKNRYLAAAVGLENSVEKLSEAVRKVEFLQRTRVPRNKHLDTAERDWLSMLKARKERMEETFMEEADKSNREVHTSIECRASLRRKWKMQKASQRANMTVADKQRQDAREAERKRTKRRAQ
jgi:hypothetical protein